MGPKVEAAISFLERGGQEVLITSPAALERAIAGETGTRIVPDRSHAASRQSTRQVKEVQVDACSVMKAEPYDFEFDPKTTALVMIDFQRDFVYPGRLRRVARQRHVVPARRAAAGRARPEGLPRGRASS